MHDDVIDLAGIGIGPFNLSAAALFAPVDGVRAAFFDRSPALAWHSGLMMPGVKLQTSWLKDLVSAVCPTSPYSFTSYLVARKRFYRFLNADFDRIPRQEFAAYLAWVAGQLPGLHFGHRIEAVEFDRNAFVLHGPGHPVRSRNLLLATGVRPRIPDWALSHLGESCFHAARFAQAPADLAGRRVAVIGGGQTGAEIVLNLLARGDKAPDRLLWLSRRPNFLPIDESPFTNEYFTPGYVERFHALPPSRKAALVEEQRLAGDGISPSTLRDLYQQLYTMSCLDDRGEVAALLPNREVVALEPGAAGWTIAARNGMTGSIETTGADLVILCTGFREAFPDCIGPLMPHLRLDPQGRFRLGRSFAVEWDGPAANRIYAQNAGRHSHGIADPQLSVMAWRSAVIINDLLGRQIYDTQDGPDLVCWEGDGTELPAPPLAARA